MGVSNKWSLRSGSFLDSKRGIAHASPQNQWYINSAMMENNELPAAHLMKRLPAKVPTWAVQALKTSALHALHVLKPASLSMSLWKWCWHLHYNINPLAWMCSSWRLCVSSWQSQCKFLQLIGLLKNAWSATWGNKFWGQFVLEATCLLAFWSSTKLSNRIRHTLTHPLSSYFRHTSSYFHPFPFETPQPGGCTTSTRA